MNQEIYQARATDPVLFETCPNCQGLGRLAASHEHRRYCNPKFCTWTPTVCPQCKGSGLIQEVE